MPRNAHDGAVAGGWRRQHGFSLVEVLVATLLVGGGLVGLAQLAAYAMEANRRAKATTIAAVLALEKMEHLRTRGAGVEPSPAEALQRNVDDYCDFFDGVGRLLGGGTSPPPGSVYVRRWAVAPLGSDPGRTSVLQVRVVASAPESEARRRLPDAARVVTLMTRKER